ncbi:MAG: flavodoxin [Bacteroidetes bacterium]|nr:MAG: flavodoxin [Bacteroidota bacterium]
MKTAIFYASHGGTAEGFARQIGELFGIADIFSMKDHAPKDMAPYDLLFFVSANYGYGHLMDDFDTKVKLLSDVDFSQKKIALVGVGSQKRHPDSFCSGLQEFVDKIGLNGAHWIGHSPATDYSFTWSRSQRGARMIGLCLDAEDGEAKNRQRIDQWADLIRPHLK